MLTNRTPLASALRRWSRRGRIPALAGICLIAAAAPAAHAYTNTTTGTINVDDTVALVCSVEVNSSGATRNFSDMSQGASRVLIGAVVEVCNDPDGYTVTLTTTNDANFKGASSGALIPYNLTYNGSTVSFANGTATLTANGCRTTAGGLTKALAISFASGYYTADNYSDTLTVTMTAQ